MTNIVSTRILLPVILLLTSLGAFAYTNETHEKGLAFLADNAKQEGVVSTSSGLQYKVLQKGSGTTHPRATDTVRVHYHGTLIDGTVFDSSVERGKTISFPLNRVIKGWTEGLQLMVVGEKTRLFIPSNLAYGFRSVGKIPAGSTLIFDVELFGINE
jgi:peptidylprolyl isomerase